MAIDRSLEYKPAGMRSLMIISMSTCLVMIISTNESSAVAGAAAGTAMFAAHTLSAFGIIGAGIIVGNKGSRQSFATAISIWLAAIIGLTIGAGMYFTGIIAAVFSYLIYGYSRRFFGEDF